MKRKQLIVMVLGMVLIFIAGIAVGYARGHKTDPSVYTGKSKQEAGKALLEQARQEAGKGSWEKIAVGRAYYLGGMKSDGQAIFDGINKKETSDWMRIGRIYYEANEWPKAKDAFDKALQGKTANDAAWLAEVGGYYNVKGDRAKAEELFKRSFGAESGEVWYTVNAGGSYLGVEPRGNS
jgi:tetratricopeptide (TPR) repeat protein